jgi:hypothetical protein
MQKKMLEMDGMAGFGVVKSFFFTSMEWHIHPHQQVGRTETTNLSVCIFTSVYIFEKFICGNGVWVAGWMGW